MINKPQLAFMAEDLSMSGAFFKQLAQEVGLSHSQIHRKLQANTGK